jgi:hypothetical protein
MIAREVESFRLEKKRRQAELGLTGPSEADDPLDDPSPSKDTNTQSSSSKVLDGKPSHLAVDDADPREGEGEGEVVRDPEADVLY